MEAMNGDGERTMSDIVLLTGGSGFIGSALARKLVARGFAVRALVRPTSAVVRLSDLGLEFTVGDLRDADAIRRAMAGVRWVFHVAGDYRLWARDPDEIFRTNVDGTRILMEAALEAGVQRVVYTSSVATLKTSSTGEPADESNPLPESEAIGAYRRSKIVAEQIVEALVQKLLPAVIVNPSTPVGPGDARPTPTGRIIVEAAAGRMPAFVNTGLNMVHVDDVAEGHLLAFDRGRIGERYILGGQNASLAEILGVVAAMTGRRAPRYQVARRALVPVAVIAEQMARWTGREPFITRDALNMSKKHMYYVSTKAERELGYKARPYAEGIRDAIAWFRRNGYLPR
jgi:dihydroflavonol-4-reductase